MLLAGIVGIVGWLLSGFVQLECEDVEVEGADGALVVADPDIRACRVEGHA